MANFLVIFLFVEKFLLSVEAGYTIIYQGPGKYAYKVDQINKKIGECVTLQPVINFPTNGTERITWKKDTHSLIQSERIKVLADGNLQIRSLEPSDFAYYQATVENTFGKATESTDLWLHVTGCGKHEKELARSSSLSCTTLCEAKCPSGWTYVIGTSSMCAQYFAKGETWNRASENCQAIGGELTTIENEVENRFISSMLETATGAWIGLNDRESESRYVWNFKQSSSQTYFTWGKNEPSNYNGNCNIENCVTMKKSNGYWNDVICDSFYPFVCQVSTSYNESDVSEWTCRGNNCFKLFNDHLVWSEAMSRCRKIHPTAHIAAITSGSINDLVRTLIKEPTWIGLNDIREAGDYQWEGSDSSFSYSNWDWGEPNDMFIRDRQLSCPGEDCVQIKKFGGDVTWHDLGCGTVLPYICERVRDRAFSTGAYVAIVIGAFLFALLVIGLTHAAYQRKKRTAVKDIIKAAYKEDIKLRESEVKEKQKISFRSAARMVVPSIKVYNNLKSS